jgi:NAD+ kinase
VDVDLVSAGHEAILSCDGRRSLAVPSGARVRVRRGAQPVHVARLAQWSFADRLVTKFQLPVRSFREAAGPAADDLIAE